MRDVNHNISSPSYHPYTITPNQPTPGVSGSYTEKRINKRVCFLSDKPTSVSSPTCATRSATSSLRRTSESYKGWQWNDRGPGSCRASSGGTQDCDTDRSCRLNEWPFGPLSNCTGFSRCHRNTTSRWWRRSFYRPLCWRPTDSLSFGTGPLSNYSSRSQGSCRGSIRRGSHSSLYTTKEEETES